MQTLPIFEFTAHDDPAKTEAGFGALRTAHGGLPLEALNVHARLDDLIASVEVLQTFVNTHAEPLEATYVFPLPDRAAVTGFRLEVAGRIIEGDLKERAQARQHYDQAIRDGHRAAIAEEERPGVFTMRVGNLPPGERARVRLTLVGPLSYCDGEVTFRFPLVVAPRYVPGTPLPSPPVGSGVHPDTSLVPDASRISPPVLLPGFASPVRLGLSVSVSPSALSPTGFRSTLHTVREEREGGAHCFRVLPGEKLDRDFVLRYQLGSDAVQTSLLAQPDSTGEGGTMLLTLVPPRRHGAVQRPRDIVFVLDRSGSMSGWKMVAARRAVSRMVETLTDEDRFTIYAFDDRVETPPDFDARALMPGNDRRRFQAAEFLARVNDRGGTEMATPLVHAVQELNKTSAAPGRDRVLVLITDGQVGNEDHILREIGSAVGKLRIFTLGIDQAVNAAFLRRLADLGGGASEVVESEQRLDEVMDSVHRHVGTPVLTGVQIRPQGLAVQMETLVPARLPDLFAGSPVVITGRYQGRCNGGVSVVAQEWQARVVPRVEAEAPVRQVWARGRVRELEDRYAIGTSDRAKLEREIVETSLRFGVLSRFTAYVAVDRSEVVNEGGQQKLITQPVEEPAGWGGSPGRTLSGGPPAAPMMRAAGLGDWDLSLRCMLPATASERSASSHSNRAKRDCFQDAEPPGLVQRLFSAMFGDGKKGVDRQSFRPRVEELLRRLRDGVADSPMARWLALRAVEPDLGQLVGELVQAGDKDPSVPRLQQLADLLGQIGGAGSDSDQCHRDLVAALEAWLGVTPTAAKAFWK